MPPAPTATATPIAEVQGARDNGARSRFARSLPSLDELSGDPATVTTNLTFSVSALLLILVATTIFNATIKENASEFGTLVGSLTGPFRGLESAIAAVGSSLPGGSPVLAGVRNVIVLALVAVIYAAVDPGFGFNRQTAVLGLSLALSIGLITLLYEGGQVLVSERAFKANASLRLSTVGILIAIASVIASRLVEMHPGIVLGFVAGSVVYARDSREHGTIVFLPMLLLLIFSLVALALVEPLRSLSNTSGSWLAVVPETSAVAIFVVGIQALLFNLIPFTFSDGSKVWSWSRPAWLALALPAVFLFVHVLLNREEAFGQAVAGASIKTLFAACLILTAIAGACWLFFRLRLKRSPAQIEPGDAPTAFP